MLRTYVRQAGRSARASALGQQRLDRLLQLLLERLVFEAPVLVEPSRRVSDGDLAVNHPRTDGGEDLPQLALGPDSSEGPPCSRRRGRLPGVAEAVGEDCTA